MNKPDTNHSSTSSRRDFLRKSSAVVVGTALVSNVATHVHAGVDDKLKVGLIGCGGRGGGAAKDALLADGNNTLVAMADVFSDHLNNKRGQLQGDAQVGKQVQVDDDHCFIGFDAYKKLLKTDVDVVILTTPPHFRPVQLKAAIEAGKHVFCEKPVAVDAPGVRSVLETTKEARKRGLSIVSGLCWRYDLGVRETIHRIQDGAIGDIVAIQENYNTGTLWSHKRKPEWSDMEYQLRNWLYYTWLSGDHITEQHVHSLDKASWLMGDKPPLRATGLGGRQVRTDPLFGNIFDHHAVCFEYPNNVRVYSYTRQQAGASNDVEDYVLGTQGQAKVINHSIRGKEKWRYRGPKPSMYHVEHQELFKGIRSGNVINNGDYMSLSTMLAIMGRMATYTGQTIAWDQAINSSEDLTPAKYDWCEMPMPLVAKPGITRFV